MLTPPPTPPPLPPDPCTQWFQAHIGDRDLCRATLRLHHLQVQLRWSLHLILGLVLLPPSLWALSPEFSLWQQVITWAAVRYGLLDHPWATIAICYLMITTLETLLWQSRNLLWGMPRREVLHLADRVKQIRDRGPGHWLWPWIWGGSDSVDYSDHPDDSEPLGPLAPREYLDPLDHANPLDPSDSSD
ncbi:MAG: hypothetical protein ACO4CG_14315 [Prochlorothrix sp.]